MDETVLKTKHNEPKRPKVQSRYLRGSSGSCHDNCKFGIKQAATETKPINPFPKRFFIAPIKRARVDTPKSTPRIEKVKSTPAIPTSNDNEVTTTSPTKTESKPMLTKTRSIPHPRIPKRHLGEIMVKNRDLSSNIRRKAKNKSKTSKDFKKPVSSPQKAPTLRSYGSLPKLKIKSSRKSNPMKPPIEEAPETPKNVDENPKSQSPRSPDTLIFEEKLSNNDNMDQISSPEGQNDDFVDVKVKHRRRGKRVGSSAGSSPVKLKFSRGRITGTHSEGSSPKRLKFRQGKVLGEDQNGKADARRLRRVGSDGAIQAPKSNQVKVVLKHQDTKEKKDPLLLYNNVIKETASKLIQKRKSKVKALVGAFENLITRPEVKAGGDNN